MPTGKQGIPSPAERELDCHRAELQQLRAQSRNAKLKYKPSQIPAASGPAAEPEVRRFDELSEVRQRLELPMI